MIDFGRDWERFHGNNLPVGRMLREQDGWNLTRFQFLPGMASTAPSHNALRAMLKRYDDIALEVLGDGEPCYIAILTTANENALQKGRHERLKARHGMTYSSSFYSPSDRVTYAVSAAETAWRPGRFNRELLMIYQRRIWEILWMNKATGAVYRPFDSGADVSAPTPRALMDLIQGRYGWLPTGGKGYVHLNPKQLTGEPLTVSKACAAAINRAVTPESADQA